MPQDNKIVALPSGERIQFPGSMADADISAAIQKHIGMSANPYSEAGANARPPVDQQFQKPPIGTPFPSSNPIEAAGQRLDLLGQREQHAQKSITPMTNAISILEPVTAARQIVGGKVGGYAGNKIAPGGTGEVVGGMLGGILAGNANEPDLMRRGAQKTLGVGTDFIQQGAEKVGESNAALVEKHGQQTQEALAGQKEKIQQAKISEPQAFAEVDAKHQSRVDTVQKANAEAVAGYRQRQKYLDTADQNSQTISDSLPQLHDAARKEASAAYGPQPKGTFDAEELKSAVQDAAQAKLQGNTKLPAAVSKIVSDIDKPPETTLLDQASVFRGAGKAMRGGGAQNASDAISVMEPKARARYLESLSPEERLQVEQPTKPAEKTSPLDAQRIHGFMSELGRASRSASISPDEVSSINATRSMLEGRLRKLYENEGRLDDFQKGQAAWKQMANTFENTKPTASGGSPVARALATKDPVTGKLRPDYVQAILSEDKAHGVATDLLNRYKHLGAPTGELEVMKTNLDAADKMPSKINWKTPLEGPSYPKFTEWGKLPETPEEPTLESYDPIEARNVALKQKGASLSGTGGPYGIMRDVMGMKGVAMGNPMALSYPILRRILGSGVGSESLTKWLAKATPEELNMAEEIPSKRVALAAKKRP